VVLQLGEMRTVRGAIVDAADTMRAVDEIDRVHAIDADEQHVLDARFMLIIRGSLHSCAECDDAEQQCH